MIDKKRVSKVITIIFMLFLAITALICWNYEMRNRRDKDYSPDNSFANADESQDIFTPSPFEIAEDGEDYPFQIIAHRGFSSKAPENTMPAFKMAASIKCNQIELDVQLTSDGTVVVYHDNNLKYITGNEGPVGAYTFEEIRKMDAGSKFNKEKYKGVKIPTLEEVLQYVQGRDLYINLELKDIGDNPYFVRKVVGLVKEYEMENQVIFSSFQYNYLQQIKIMDNDLKIEVVAENGEGWFLYENYPADYYNLKLSNINQTTINLLHDVGAKVYVWTVDDEKNMRKAISMNVDGIVTNCPDKLKLVVEND